MLYAKPVNEITWDDVQSFCEQGIAEGAFLDYKLDFPAQLEKTIAAMANTLGGIILIGVDETDEGKPVLPLSGIQFQRGLSERVLNIVLTNIVPPSLPEVGLCRDTSGERAILVIRIPQSHQTPHAIAQSTQVYLRTGNRNAPEALARVDDIEWLRERRGKSEDLRKRLYARAEERFTTLYQRQLERVRSAGRSPREVDEGWLKLYLCPLYPRSPFCSPPEMKDAYRAITVPEYCGTGSTFPLPDSGSSIIVQDGVVRSSAQRDGEDIYHTELNCLGLYFYKQSLAHDYRPPMERRSYRLMRAAEIWARLNEFLDSGSKLYSRLGYWGPLDFRAGLERIAGCALGPWSPRGAESVLVSLDPEVWVERNVLASDLKSSKPYLFRDAAKHIGWAFGWNVTEEILDAYDGEVKRLTR